MSVDSVFGTMTTVSEFTLDIAVDRKATYDTLLHRGRRVVDVEARVIEAQYRFPDGSTLLLLSDDTPFKELMTILLVSAGLKELDRVLLGGAFTPGYLTYAYPNGPDSIAFCWHDLEQVVTVSRRRSRLGLRTRWLDVQEVTLTRPASPLSLGSRLTTLFGSVFPWINRGWVERLRRR